MVFPLESGTLLEWTTDDRVVLGARSALTIATLTGFCAGVMMAIEWILYRICCAGCLEGLAL